MTKKYRTRWEGDTLRHPKHALSEREERLLALGFLFAISFTIFVAWFEWSGMADKFTEQAANVILWTRFLWAS